MKRFSKILALALLLAVAVTAFGVFSAFAEDTAGTNRTIHYDMDDTSKWQTPLNSTTDTLTQTDDGYWKLSINSGSKQCYIKNMGQLDSTGATISDYTVAISEFKYLVYDFDISSDSTLTDGLYFRPAFDSNPTGFQFIINAETYDAESNRHISISTKANTNLNYGANIDIGTDKWVGVSIVLDFNDFANGNVTYYVYINGTYAGAKLVDGLSSLTTYKYLRVYTAGAATKASSINFANFNISYFANDSLSGQTLGEGTTLSADGELAYCLESPNDACTEHVDENADDLCDDCGVYVGPMASIGDVKYDNIEDLQAAIENNVTVTIYEDIDDVIFYPKDATITFKDKNGVEIGADGCAVTATLQAVDTTTYDWAVVVDGGVILGSTTEENTKYDGTTIADELHTKLVDNKAKDIRVVLFDDVIMYGATGTETAQRLRFTKTITFNLNGHTLDVDNSNASRSVFEPHATDASISFYHGAIEYVSVVKSDLYFVNSTVEPHSSFYDCTITAESNFLSQRGGAVLFDGCTITANASLAYLTTKSGLHSELTVNNCTITGNDALGNDAGLFVMGPQSSNGSVTYAATISETTINVPCHIIFHEMRSTGTESDTNSFDIDIINSIITSTKGSIFAEKANWVAASASGLEMTDTITLNLTNSALNADDYIYNRVALGNNYLPESENYNSVVYNFTVNADATSKISARKALANKVTNVETGEDESGEAIYTPVEHSCVVIVFNLAEGVAVNFKQVHTDCTTIAPEVNIPDKCIYAYTSLYPGYNKVVTSKYTTYQYQIGTANPVDFYWNNAEGDAVDVTLVELPSTSVYTYKLDVPAEESNIYTATLIPNFTPSVSMSTDGTLSLNFFIPENVYTALKEAGGLNITGEYIEAIGADLSQYGKNGTFAQIKVTGIDPVNATDIVLTVAFNLADDNGLAYARTFEISVLSYAQSVLKNGTDVEKQYAVQLLNYVKAVMAYAGEDTAAVNAAITASGLTVNTGNVGTGVLAGDLDVTVEMNLGASFNWILTVEGDDTYTVTYTRDGEEISVQRTAKDGKIVVSLRAYDVLNSITITSDNASKTFNLADYYATQGDNAKTVLDALAAYATAAEAFRLTLADTNS